MESNAQTPSIAGSTMILSGMCVLGILASLAFSGYAAIALGIFAIILAAITGQPRSPKDRVVVFSLAGLSILLGIGAVVLGMVASALS
ncbi:MAG: hypothetical protein ACE361_21065 [Aureliella sp.]